MCAPSKTANPFSISCNQDMPVKADAIIEESIANREGMLYTLEKDFPKEQTNGNTR